jgi:hypothetical protein
MEFPDEILEIIRKYSKPYRTRRDWRLCKQREAFAIKQYNQITLNRCNHYFGDTDLGTELLNWSLHGRKWVLRHIYRYENYQIIYFTQSHTDWYITRVQLFSVAS